MHRKKSKDHAPWWAYVLFISLLIILLLIIWGGLLYSGGIPPMREVRIIRVKFWFSILELLCWIFFMVVTQRSKQQFDFFPSSLVMLFAVIAAILFLL